MKGRGGRFGLGALARVAFLGLGLGGVAAAVLISRFFLASGGLAGGSARPRSARAELEVASRPMASVGVDPGALERLLAGPQERDDRRLRPLLLAAASWKTRDPHDRRVVDQVCLVPDADAFLEALAAWDQRSYFPILIDEPAWVLPFLRAFRPARVVRYAGRGGRPANALVGWRRAVLAVARAWGPEGFDGNVVDEANLSRFDAVAPPRGQARSPGVVLSSPGAPMLVGAAALAAGRFEPLIRVDPPSSPGADPHPWNYASVPGLVPAWMFAGAVETRVSMIAPRYKRLGDDCDFITVAGDFPYRYRAAVNEAEPGEYAFDDVLGRVVDRAEPGDWMARTKERWAFTGRLMGDPAASVAHAMGALFLKPASALLWDAYDQAREPWTDYNLISPARRFARMLGGPERVVFHDGANASLAHWHAALEPPRRADLFFLNSTGGPDRFTITGGPGRPADLPAGTPCAVAMIHSFSAADPADPATIAGRWLAQGAYAYFGAMYEPYLLGFRKPRLIAELIESGMPLAAAVRQGESEVLGHPWRMVYLGDPLFQLEPSPGAARESFFEWERTAPGADSWPVRELAPEPTLAKPVDPAVALEACLDVAIAESPVPERAGSTLDWTTRLKAVDRAGLEPVRRRIFDELAIDVLRERGAYDALWEVLISIPPGERGPRVWAALEACAVVQFARASASASITMFDRAVAVWEGALRQPWPTGSGFPSQLTERAGDLARQDAPRRASTWRARLGRLARELPDDSPSAQALIAERARLAD